MAKKSEKETKKKSVHDVEVKIEGKDWADAIDKAFAKKQKTAKVDGFRKGKVPRHVYEKKFGKESLFFDAAELVIQDAYMKALDKSKLSPVVQPGVNITNISEDGVEFVFKMVTKPEVVVKKYKGLGIKPIKVKVNEIKEKKARELDEDFFEDLGMEGIDTEEKLRDNIKSSITAQKEMENENKYVDDLLEAVGKNVEVDIPEEMVSDEIDRLMRRFEEQMKMQGISLDLYYQFTKSDEAQLRSQMEKEAFNNVLYRLMIEEIQKLEKIEVTDKEVEEEAQKLADKYQMDKEEFLKQFGGIDLVKYDLEVRKVVDLLKELNK